MRILNLAIAVGLILILPTLTQAATQYRRAGEVVTLENQKLCVAFDLEQRLFYSRLGSRSRSIERRDVHL